MSNLSQFVTLLSGISITVKPIAAGVYPERAEISQNLSPGVLTGCRLRLCFENVLIVA